MNNVKNNVQNSDSEQCPELKLGWVHRMHTQGPGCMLGRSCCGAPGAVSQASPTPYRGLPLGRVAVRTGCVRRPCCVLCHESCRRTPLEVLRVVSQPPRPCRAPPDRIVAHARSCRSIVSRHRQWPGLPPATIQPIVS